MSTVLGGCNHGNDLSGFDAVTIARTGSFELDMTPEEALPLFTAPGSGLPTPGTRSARLAASGQSGGQTASDSLTFKLVQTTEADQGLVGAQAPGAMNSR